MHCGRKPGAQRLAMVGDVLQRDPYVASEERMRTNLFASALGSAITAGVSQVKLDVCYRCPDKLIRAVSVKRFSPLSPVWLPRTRIFMT